MSNEEKIITVEETKLADWARDVADESYFRGFQSGSTAYYDIFIFAHNNPLVNAGAFPDMGALGSYVQFLNVFSGMYMPKTYHRNF